MDGTNRVLIIDDEEGIREGCRRVLESAGYIVETVSSGREGLERCKEHQFDVILLDVMLPDGRGIDIIPSIRATDPEAECLVITGYASIDLAVQAIRAGAYDFLAKPFSADLLHMSVQQALEHRRLMLESRRLQEVERQAGELARAKAELERLDRFKTSFMWMVAHELRAPLTSLQSFLLSILKGYIPAEEQLQILQRAYERTEDLLALIDDLLKLAAVKSEQGEDRHEPFSLADVLDKVTPLFRAEAQSKSLAWKQEVRCRPLVVGNADQFAQVWSNLISNAVKYSPAGGEIQILLDMQDGWAIGCVKDTGIGIAPEELPFIFKEFYRSPKAKEMAPHGTGLGLALVKQIVEHHGGVLEVKSELGQGSLFTFRVPLAGEETKR